MALVTRKGKVIWDDKSNTMPGKVYNEYLNNIKYSKNIEKNSFISFQNSKKEISNLEETNTLYTVILPEFIENNIKPK